MTITTTPAEQVEHEAIHGWFGLSYANYLVLPRTLLQSMPDEWQSRFVACLRELGEAFAHIDQAEAYEVTPGVEREVGDLTDDELKRIGYSKNDPCTCYAELAPEGGVVHHPPVCPHETTYYDERGIEVPYDHLVVWPTADPVPHYNRGRTHVEPLIKE